MISKIIDKVNDRKLYKKWIEIIESEYSQINNCINDLYKVKNNLDPELSFIYVNKLMAYYTQLNFLNRVYIQMRNDLSEKVRMHNYNMFGKEIDKLISTYHDYLHFILSLEDIKNPNEAFNNMPSEIFSFSGVIEENFINE